MLLFHLHSTRLISFFHNLSLCENYNICLTREQVLLLIVNVSSSKFKIKDIFKDLSFSFLHDNPNLNIRPAIYEEVEKMIGIVLFLMAILFTFATIVTLIFMLLLLANLVFVTFAVLNTLWTEPILFPENVLFFLTDILLLQSLNLFCFFFKNINICL